MAEISCPYCGKTINSSEKFCEFCGENLEDEVMSHKVSQLVKKDKEYETRTLSKDKSMIVVVLIISFLAAIVVIFPYAAADINTTWFIILEVIFFIILISCGLLLRFKKTPFFGNKREI